jgi:hypothetical protein
LCSLPFWHAHEGLQCGGGEQQHHEPRFR